MLPIIRSRRFQSRVIDYVTFSLVHTQVRFIVRCTECNFRRVLYAKYSIEKKDLSRIASNFEEKLYICGAQTYFPYLFQNAKL